MAVRSRSVGDSRVFCLPINGWMSSEELNISNLWENISKILFFYENNPMSYCGIQVTVFGT
jgi:hypothetical protein